MVEQVCFLFVADLHGFGAAHVLDPVEHFVQRVDAKHRRRIVGGILGDEGAVLEEFRHVRAGRFKEFLPDDGKRHAGGAEIFLDARPDHSKLVAVHAAGEDIAGHIADDRHIHLGEFPVFRAVDGVVRGDMEIVRAGADVVGVRDVGVIFVLCRIGVIGLAEELRRVPRLVGPHAGVRIGRAGVEEIAGLHEELHGAAALNKDDLLSVLQLEELREERLRLGEKRLKFGGAVAHLDDAHASAAEIGPFLPDFLQHGKGHRGRPCIEIPYAFHNESSFSGK